MSDEEMKQNLIHYVQRLNVSFSINFQMNAWAALFNIYAI